MSPVVLGLLCWTLAPFVAAFYFSFTRYSILKPPQWVGLSNYVEALSGKDELFWPNALDDAGYVHRLAVARDAHGEGTGRRLIQWAEEQASARGKRFLRLDTGAHNGDLRAYYEALGFELRSVRVVGSWTVAMFERAVHQQPRVTDG